MTPLGEAIRMAVRGEYPPGVSEIDGHEFYIRAIGNRNLLQRGETSYFRHSHVGKDDRIFYSIELNDGTYTAKLTRIQFRGPFTKNGFKDFGDHGIDVTGAVEVSSEHGLGTPPDWGIVFAVFIAEVQAEGYLGDNWLPATAKVTDMIGKEMAAQ